MIGNVTCGTIQESQVYGLTQQRLREVQKDNGTVRKLAGVLRWTLAEVLLATKANVLCIDETIVA